MSDSLTVPQSNNIRDSLLVCAAIVVILAGAKEASYLLQPFLLAIFFAVICSAPINRLMARGVPGWMASILVGLVTLVLLALVFSLIGGTVDDFRAAMPGYQEQFRQLVAQWSSRLEGFGISLSRDGLATVLDPAAAVGFFGGFLGGLGDVLGNAAAPPVLLSLLEGSALLTGSMLALYLAVNTLVGNVIEPRWMGQAVGLSTLAVFVSLVFWGYMFGAIGMLLSVPLTMVIKFMALQNPGSAWFGILLSSIPAEEPEQDNEEQL